MVFTSDQSFFDRIGEKETKRYFDECYKFICNYNNLGEKNVISAVVHLDEGAPHMHLMFVPVIHTIEKETRTFINPVEQLKHEEIEKEWDLER